MAESQSKLSNPYILPTDLMKGWYTAGYELKQPVIPSKFSDLSQSGVMPQDQLKVQ